MANYGVWSGINQALGNVSNTAINLMQLQGQQQHQAAIEANNLKRLQMEEARTQEEQKLRDIQVANANLQLQDAQRKQAEYDSPMDITTHPAYLSLPPESQKFTLNFFYTNGFTDANGKGKTGDITRGLGVLENTKPIFQEAMAPVVAAKKNATIQAWNVLQEAKASGDQKKIALADSQYKSAYEAYQISSGNFDKHLAELDKREFELQKLGIEEAGKNNRAAADRVDTSGKPTEGDKRYNSYVEQMRSQGKNPWTRYQFDVWYNKQTSNKKPERSLDASLNPPNPARVPTF